jgi:hypothetical protein
MDQYIWPMNPASPKIDPSLDWAAVEFKTIKDIDVRRLRAIPLPMLKNLHSKYKELWALMEESVQEAGLALLEGRAVPSKKLAEGGNKKDELLNMIATVEEIGCNDAGLLLKAIETRAKLESLLNVKNDAVDPVITINVITGVNR